MTAKNCCLCDQPAMMRQASDRDKMYMALDVYCPECGVYRIANAFLEFNPSRTKLTDEYAKFLSERPVEEKEQIY